MTTDKKDQPENTLMIKEEAADMKTKDHNLGSSQLDEEVEDKKLQLIFEELHRTIK